MMRFTPGSDCRASVMCHSGFSLLEVLVALVVLTFGLLGLAAMQGRAFSSESEAYQRSQAIILLDDIVERISANRRVALCFANASPYGTGVTTNTSCEGSGVSGDDQAKQNADKAIVAWQGLLRGTNEVLNGGSVGGIANARGCIRPDTRNNRPPPPDPPPPAIPPPLPQPAFEVYYVALAWQGRVETLKQALPANPDDGLIDAIACGDGNYGGESFRRVVWTSVRIGELN